MASAFWSHFTRGQNKLKEWGGELKELGGDGLYGYTIIYHWFWDSNMVPFSHYLF